MRKIVFDRPLHEVALFGGPASVVLTVGAFIRTHPTSDLFKLGVTRVEVRKIVGGAEPYLMVRSVRSSALRGKLLRLGLDHVLIDEKGL